MLSNSTDSDRIVRILNSLLRSEITATESYTQAIPRVSFEVEALREIAREHGQAVSDLRAEIKRVGGIPDETSGMFPAMPSKPVAGPAKVFGEAATLRALMDIEERGLGDYREALDRLNGDSSGWISETRIPAQIKHLDRLEQLLSKL